MNTESGYQHLAKEFLRAKLIGKKVTFQVDYIQPPSENYPGKTCITVHVNKKNISEKLVENGLATVIRHKKEDTNRSAFLFELLEAERIASEKKVGIFSSLVPTQRLVEVSESSSKAMSFLPFLKRGRIEAIVDHVVSLTRYRLFVPSENCRSTFVLSGVSCPRDASSEIARLSLLQRQVFITVDNVDKNGAILGKMFAPNDIALGFLKEGLIMAFSQDPQYIRMEEEAKKSKLGIWENEEQEEVQQTPMTLELAVTHVVNGGLFFAQTVCEEIAEFERMMNQLNSCDKISKPYSVGDLVACRFSADQRWYRARILSKEVSPLVQFIDYGNCENANSSDIRFLSEEFKKLPAQSKEYKLDLLAPSEPSMDCYEESKEMLMSLLSGKVQAEVIGKKCKLIANGKSINEEMIRGGFATTENDEWKEAQEEARQSRRNLWRFGDFFE